MDQKTAKLITDYVNENIDSFHTRRIAALQELTLDAVLKRKNPYLFRAKNLTSAPDLIKALLDARLSSSEETAFGGFLERLAKFAAENTGGASKSSTTGLDIDLIRDGVRYLISVKSGRSWGNKGQHDDLKLKFRTAVTVIKQQEPQANVQPTLGICYGSFKRSYRAGYLHIGGQDFWELISGDSRFYIDIIEPLGFRATEHNAEFDKRRAEIYAKLSTEFGERFCTPGGEIDWQNLVKFVSEVKPTGKAKIRNTAKPVLAKSKKK